MYINDPSTNQAAIVDKEGHVHARSLAVTEQRFVSEEQGNAYQIFGYSSDVGGSTHPVLFLRNDSEIEKVLVVNFIRMVAIDLGTTGSFGVTTYFLLNFDQTYTSDGTLLTPVNMNRSDGKTAPGIVAYSGASTLVLGGTAVPGDRWHPAANLSQEQVWDKRGSIVLTPGHSMDISLVTDFTAGVGFSRISFMLVDPHTT